MRRSRRAARSASRRRARAPPTIESSRSKATISSASSSLADLARRVDAPLSLAVVAEPPRLHERRAARSRRASRTAPSGCRAARKSSFSTSRSWPSSSARGGGSGASSRGGCDGDVLELVGDDVGARGEARERVRVVEGADDELAHLARPAPSATGRGSGTAARAAARRARASVRADRRRCRRRASRAPRVTRRGRARRARTASARPGTRRAARGCRRRRARGSPPRAAPR